MAHEPAVHLGFALLTVGGSNGVGLAGHALAQEKDVDHDVRAGIGPEAAFGEPNGGDTSADFAMCSRAAASCLSMVSVLVTKAASPAGFKRSIDRAIK